MDSATVQFMYRWLVCTFCVAFIGTLLFMFVLAFRQGDGEEQAVVATFTPILTTSFLGIAGVLGLHQAGAAVIQYVQAKNGTPPASVTQAPAPAGGI